MMVPAAFEALHGNPAWRAFVASAAITGFAGLTLSMTTRTKKPVFSVRHAFIFYTVAWRWFACSARCPLSSVTSI